MSDWISECVGEEGRGGGPTWRQIHKINKQWRGEERDAPHPRITLNVLLRTCQWKNHICTYVATYLLLEGASSANIAA